MKRQMGIGAKGGRGDTVKTDKREIEKSWKVSLMLEEE